MKIKTGLFFVVFLTLFYTQPFAKVPVSIAFINMDMAVNMSEAGQRSKNIIRSKIEVLKKNLESQKEAIMMKENELKNSMMLSQEAKKRKEQEYLLLINNFKRDEANANDEIRGYEQRHIKNIYEDLQDIIAKVAQKKKIDLVLEKRTVLYSRKEWVDITDAVIKEYDKVQKKK